MTVIDDVTNQVTQNI